MTILVAAYPLEDAGDKQISCAFWSMSIVFSERFRYWKELKHTQSNSQYGALLFPEHKFPDTIGLPLKITTPSPPKK